MDTQVGSDVNVVHGLKVIQAVRRSLQYNNKALSYMISQFNTDKFTQYNLMGSIEIFLKVKKNGGKIVISGIGKSFKIASKLVATMNSLSIQSILLHPAEALHGDLGIINDRDCVIMLTASGNTPELIQLVPHIPSSVPITLLTGNRKSKLADCPRIDSLLLTEVPEYLSEDSVHGVPAPTISTTLALALGDATILALSELLEEDVNQRRKAFHLKHPGGAIGAELSSNSNAKSERSRFSSETSSSSLSSLDSARLWKSYGTNGLVSPEPITDIDEIPEKPRDLKKFMLSERIKATEPSKILILKDIRDDQWSLSLLFRWTVLYDYIINEKDAATLAVACDELKDVIRDSLNAEESLSESAWKDFVKTLNSKFLNISF